MADTLVDTGLYTFTNGFNIVYTVNIDLTDLSIATLLIKKPNGLVIKRPMELTVDSKLLYTVEEKDFDRGGVYKFQLKLEMQDGFIGYSRIDYIRIEASLDS